MSKPLIICVDDEKIILDSLKQELGTTFKDLVEIEVAESADEAIELIEEEIEDGREIPIIISDYVMPVMKGDEFLIQCSKFLPKSKRILLTGQATAEGVGNAVINAGLYRFISKPWDKEDLELTISEAFRSFYKDKKIAIQETKLDELNRSLKVKIETQTKDLKDKNFKIKVLLNQTIKGLVSSFVKILAKVDPDLLEKSLRIKEIAQKVSNNYNDNLNWEVEVASLICLIGLIDLNYELKIKFFKGEKLNHVEINEIRHAIKSSVEIISNIPQFESINKGVSEIYYGTENVVNGNIDSNINDISRILRIVLDYDNKIQGGLDNLSAITELDRFERYYDDKIYTIFKEVVLNSVEKENDKYEISATELKVGMRLAGHLKDKKGNIVINKNDEINHGNLMLINRLSKKKDISEPINIYK